MEKPCHTCGTSRADMFDLATESFPTLRLSASLGFVLHQRNASVHPNKVEWLHWPSTFWQHVDRINQRFQSGLMESSVELNKTPPCWLCDAFVWGLVGVFAGDHSHLNVPVLMRQASSWHTHLLRAGVRFLDAPWMAELNAKWIPRAASMLTSRRSWLLMKSKDKLATYLGKIQTSKNRLRHLLIRVKLKHR